MQDLIPAWLAGPAAWLSTAAALAGSGFLFWSAVTGGYWWAVWGVVSFAGAGGLWLLSDRAGRVPSGGNGGPSRR